MQEKDQLLQEHERVIDELSAQMLEVSQRAENAEATVTALEEKEQKYLRQLCTTEQQSHDQRLLVMAKDAEISALQEQITQLQEAAEQQQQTVEQLQQQVESAEASVEKLQTRCAALVAEKSEKLRQLDQERQEMLQHVQKFRVSRLSTCGAAATLLLHCGGK